MDADSTARDKSDFPDAEAKEQPPNEAVSSRYKLATVLILCSVNLVYYMDRFSIAGIITQIQCYFHVGDDSGGLLQSIFILGYALSAPVTGYLGDRYSRK